MGKLVKLGVYVFAFIGVVMTAGFGYVYATNTELMDEFWSVKDDFRNVPAERRTEVVAELPARITFEREVASELAELPEERRVALYEQLKESRDLVYSQFKQRISAEAAVAREMKKASKPVEDVAKEIENQLGKVNVGIDMTGKGSKPAVNNLAAVDKAIGDVADARMAYGEARESSVSSRRVDAAVNLLEALDKLGDQIVLTRKAKLTTEEKSRLDGIIKDAKATLYDAKQTPGLNDNARAMKLTTSIPSKLSQ